MRGEMAWRDLPACYGPWNSVSTRWLRWCALGLWQEILGLLSRQATGCLRFIDGTHIKLHQFGTNPAGGQLERGRELLRLRENGKEALQRFESVTSGKAGGLGEC